MEQYQNFLSEFDESYEQLQTQIKKKNYAEATSIQGYLLGMIRTIQILRDSETDTALAKEIRDRVMLLNE